MIQLATLLAICVANGHEDLITKALLVDTNNNTLDYDKGDYLNVQVSKERALKFLKPGHKYVKEEYRMIVACPIVKVNPMALKDMYGVNIAAPGEPVVIDWVRGHYSEPSPTELTEEAKAKIAFINQELNGRGDEFDGQGRIISPRPEEPMI